MNRKSRLFSLSPKLLRRIAGSLGAGAEVGRLCDSLQVDVTPARERLDWKPSLTVDEGLRRTVTAYMKSTSR